MNFTVTVTETHQENMGLIYENYCTYTTLTQKKKGLKQWRCTKNACKAFVRTDAGCKTVVPINIEHISNHTADEH